RLVPPGSFEINIDDSDSGPILHAACCWRHFASEGKLSDAAPAVLPPHLQPLDEPVVDIEALQKLDAKACAALAESLHRNGYCRVLLTPQTAELVQAYHSGTAKAFFQQHLDEKMKHALVKAGQHRYGYFPRPDMGKELFQVRLSDAKTEWPSVADFRAK